MLPRLIGFNACEDIGFNRVGAHVGKHFDCEACCFHIGHNLLHHGHGSQVGIRHKQGAHDAIGLAELSQFIDAAGAKLECGGVAEIAVGNGHSCILIGPLLFQYRS